MTMPTNASLSINGGQKISPSHCQRLACIYIRQSSLKQVRDNTESQIYQYRLQERAQSLGWADDQIRVIDSDQGTSGSSSDARVGYQELVSLVSMGKVGIIFGYEVSRLARNNADWYPLLELAGVFGVLIADNDAVYDPQDFNDRMVLGLKGTMSELELHLIRQRLNTGRMNQIMRAEYRQPLPTGLVRQRDNIVVKDPDEQVRDTIQLVLDKFAELGSGVKVQRHLLDHQILLPRRQVGGALHNEILWREPAYAAIYTIIKNPAYAGAFAHGRTQLDPAKRQAFGSPSSGRLTRPMAEWIHLQQDVYPAYISWDQYMANQEKLTQNATKFEPMRTSAQGAARKGGALLQGFVHCGCCARRMHVRHRRVATYACSELYNSLGRKSCLFVQAPKIDAAVVQAFFEAIKPAQLDALAALLKQQDQERNTLDKQWQQQLKRAEYEALRAERQYNQVDPDNRLVASTLEKRWEESLQNLHTTQRNYQAFQQTQTAPAISTQLQQQFQNIAQTLPDLWPKLPNQQKKELLRTLISQVILTPKESEEIEVKIVWVSGHFTTLIQHRHPKRWQHVPRYDEMLKRIHTLWQDGTVDHQIAQLLNDEGFVTIDGGKFNRVSVLRLRLKQGWQHRAGNAHHDDIIDGLYTVRGLAKVCTIEPQWIRWCIKNQTIEPTLVSKHPSLKIYLIDASPSLIEVLRTKAANRKYYKTRSKEHSS